MTCRLLPIVAATLGLVLGAAHSFGQSLSTYQGVLRSEGQPYTGTADIRFRLFDAENDQVWGPFDVSGVDVVDGVFTTQIPIGNRVNGPGFTLGLAVRTPSGSGDFVTLSPRQPITVAPFAAIANLALTANTASSADVANTAALAQNTRGIAVTQAGDVSIRNTLPERMLHLGSPTLGSEALIRLSSRATSTPAARTWDIGVPGQETFPLAGAAYNFVINDVGAGRDPLTDPMFTVQYSTGRVGINTPNPTSMLHVNGEARANTLRADTEARAATVVATSNVQTPEVRFGDGTTQASAFRMFRVQRTIVVSTQIVGQTQQYVVSFPSTVPLFTGNETVIINLVSNTFRQGLILGAPTIIPATRDVRFSTLAEIQMDYGVQTINVTVIP